jgi:hypothetical protein
MVHELARAFLQYGKEELAARVRVMDAAMKAFEDNS